MDLPPPITGQRHWANKNITRFCLFPGTEKIRFIMMASPRAEKKGLGFLVIYLPETMVFTSFYHKDGIYKLYGSGSKPCTPGEHQNSW
jgi:hypothetical protein